MRGHEPALAFGVGIADDQVIARGKEIRRHRAALLTETDEADGG
jgi:hypothetical protein